MKHELVRLKKQYGKQKKPSQMTELLSGTDGTRMLTLWSAS